MVQAQRLVLSDAGGKLLPNGFTQVGFWTDEVPCPWFIWKLIPVNVGGMPTPSKSSSEALGNSGPPPPYDDGYKR
jgi:hypothetical protein